MQLLLNGKRVKWKQEGDAVHVTIPNDVRNSDTAALVFAFTPAER